jgi:signal transduction histidine kinase
LIHLTGGRIETHFHVFCSLAILAFYRDLRILVPATVVVAIDHFVRGIYWPESVYGVANPEWWRFLEHAGWVMFLDGFLIYNCLESHRELWRLCEQQVALDDAKESASRLERMAALGQLAASVGHELRNPLAAIRNAHAYIGKRLRQGGEVDSKIRQFSDIIHRELDASGKIITNLLDFSRPRAPSKAPCPLRPLVEEAVGLVPGRAHVQLVNEVPEELPVPDLDKDQFRQVLINLVQNAVESIPEDQPGKVVVRARADAGSPWRIDVIDSGTGMTPDLVEKIFQPLFSTKVKGTGLGLSVVASMVQRHGGTLHVQSEVGSGTTFTIELPARAQRAA